MKSPWMPWPWLATALSCLLLAGCLGSGDASPPEPGPATGTAPDKVQPALATIKVVVMGVGGVLLQDAQVRVGASAVAPTDANGVATVATEEVGDGLLVKVSRTGYVPQVLRVATHDPKAERQLLVVLQAIKQELGIGQVEAGAVYRADSLGASVSLPADALVVATTGQPARGAARLQLTPWNITSQELSAMPGNGLALNGEGVEGRLVSAGMMTVDFFDVQGNRLQLAPGKTALLQMDLPAYSINGESLGAGSVIPLWHFDESRGLWLQDGEGSVVTSRSSPTGLAVQARVGHFSTWNWDFFNGNNAFNNNNVNIMCVGDDGSTGVPCTISADVTLSDGSKFYHHGGDSNTTEVSAAGIRITLLPAGATIVWTGIGADGRSGTLTTGPNGSYKILLGTPRTANRVRCDLPDGSAVGCQVTLSLVRTNGTTATATLNIAAGGGQLVTGIVGADTLTWTAVSNTLLNDAGQPVRYTGSTTSGPTGDVTIQLVDQTVLAGKTVFFQCEAMAQIEASANGTTDLIDECRLNVSLAGSTSGESSQEQFSVTASAGARVPVWIPPEFLSASLEVDGSAITAGGQFTVISTTESTTFWPDVAQLQDGAVMLLKFSSNLGVLN